MQWDSITADIPHTEGDIFALVAGSQMFEKEGIPGILHGHVVSICC